MRPGPAAAPGRALPRTAAGAGGLPEGSGCGPGSPGGGGWGQPGRAGTGKEGCPSRLRAPGVPEADRRAVRRLHKTDLPPGLSERLSRLLRAEDFPIGCVI